MDIRLRGPDVSLEQKHRKPSASSWAGDKFPAKAKRAETLFRDALRGKIRLATSLLVIAEIIWTLESFYKLEKLDIAAKVEKILNTPNLECPEAPLIFMALDLYVHANIDFVDAYNAFHMRERGLTQILTYDRKHFARGPWV